MTPNHPANFRPGPPALLPDRHPLAQPARLVEVPAYDPAAHLPPPPPLPTLTVNGKGIASLTKPLMAALRLYAAQPINLWAPPPGSPYWHLDLRREATRRLEGKDREGAGRIRGIILPPAFAASLSLVLLPGDPTTPGYYPMLPAHAFLAHHV